MGRVNTLKAISAAFTVLLVVWCTSSFELRAQQDPQYSQYMFNQLAINPAYAGSKEALSGSLFVREQWTGIGQGRPSTQTLSVHSPLKNKKMALGLTIIADHVGPKNSTGILAAYAYRIKLGSGKLSMGLRVGAYLYAFDWTKIDYKDKADVAAANGKQSITVPTADAGLYYYTNSFYFGFSAEHLNNGRLVTVSNMTGDSARLSPHLFLTTGKAWELSDNFIFNPSLMIKAAGTAPASADLNFSFLIQQKLWVGISLRPQYGIVGYTQFYITDKFKVGYSYDFGMNKVGRYGGGTHELMLSYDLKLSKAPFFSPRYF